MHPDLGLQFFSQLLVSLRPWGLQCPACATSLATPACSLLHHIPQAQLYSSCHRTRPALPYATACVRVVTACYCYQRKTTVIPYKDKQRRNKLATDTWSIREIAVIHKRSKTKLWVRSSVRASLANVWPQAWQTQHSPAAWAETAMLDHRSAWPQGALLCTASLWCRKRYWIRNTLCPPVYTVLIFFSHCWH